MQFESLAAPEITPARRSSAFMRGVLALSLVSLVVALSGIMWLYHSLQELRSELDQRTDELAWSFEVHQQFHDDNDVSPEVGTIQFLDNGFSIEFEKASYTPAGLELEGFVGNPTVRWVSQLTLNFWAYQPFFLKRDEFMAVNPEERYLFLPDEIGHAQSQSIPLLAPGRRAPFRVTIPNVAQTKEGFTLTVNFSGERYGYGLQ